MVWKWAVSAFFTSKWEGKVVWLWAAKRRRAWGLQPKVAFERQEHDSFLIHVVHFLALTLVDYDGRRNNGGAWVQLDSFWRLWQRKMWKQRRNIRIIRNILIKCFFNQAFWWSALKKKIICGYLFAHHWQSFQYISGQEGLMPKW